MQIFKTALEQLYLELRTVHALVLQFASVASLELETVYQLHLAQVPASRRLLHALLRQQLLLSLIPEWREEEVSSIYHFNILSKIPDYIKRLAPYVLKRIVKKRSLLPGDCRINYL
jgi:hypothetical protein